MKMRSIFRLAVFAPFLLAATESVRAADIAWTTDATETTTVDEIDVSGSLAHAGTWGTTATNVTVGAEMILFDLADNADATVTQAGANGAPDRFAEPGGFDADFLIAMDSFAYDGDNPKVLTLNNLTAGNIYTVQLFVSDDRTCCSARTQLWSDNPTLGAGNETRTFAHSESTFSIGQFIADATSQLVYGHGVAQNQNIINAYVLRDLGPAVDSDNDGVPDGLDDEPANPNNDSDGDGLGNFAESDTHGSDPLDTDSDDDGLDDGAEVNTHGTDPTDPDHDGDNYNDGFEVANVASGFDPLVDDSAEDPDNDGLDNGEEFTAGSDALDDDSDNDTVNDGDEVNGNVNPYSGGVLGAPPGESTLPTDDDSDDDGVLDGAETDNANGSVTDPNNLDTDGDGADDGLEISLNTDPTDEDDFPEVIPPDATMSWIAASDLDGDNLWKTIEEPDIVGLAWDFGIPKSPSFGVANLPGVTAWYSAPSATMQSFNDAPLTAAPFSQNTNQPSSFELVFRPGDLIENHLLFETGGNGDGTAFVINGDTLEFRAQDANNAEQRIILNHTFTAGDDLNFHHCVATIQTGDLGTAEGVLYINGVQADLFNPTGAVNDWAGGDDSGLGIVNGGTTTGQSDFSAFTGDIAILRFYGGTILTAEESLVLYNALAGGTADSDDDDLPDSWEMFYFEDLDEDGAGNTDGDGLTHAEELTEGTDPTKADTDDDGTEDDDELTGAVNPYTAGVLGDAPGDPTNPNAFDSDSDGASDGDETSSANGSVSDPNNSDTDGDGMPDGPEIALGRNPTDPSDAKTGLAGGLVAYWPFENDSLEDIAHLSGATDSSTADDGTFTGPATDVAFAAAGKFGESALEQNGEAGWVTVSKSLDTIGNDVTKSVSVSAWLKADAFDIAWQAAVSHGEGAFWRIARNNANDTMAYAGGGGDIFSTTAFTPPSDWFHIVAVTDNGTSRIYVNGTEEGSGNVNLNTSLAAAPDMMIGNNPERLARVWEGSIDDVAIWNRPLTQAEVDSIYADGDGASIADLIGIGEPDNFRITKFTFDDQDGAMSITWNSKEGESYRIAYTTDLSDWDGELDDAFPAAVGTDTTTYTFNRSGLIGIETAPRVQFRVEEN